MDIRADAQPSSTPRLRNVRRKVIQWTIILAVIGLGALIYKMMQPHSVIIVNGLPKPYTVEVNGQVVQLAANNMEMVELSQGEIQVKAYGKDLHFPDQTISFRLPRFGLRAMTAVINPDRLAVLATSAVQYESPNAPYIGGRGTGEKTTYLTGQAFYLLEKIDVFNTTAPSQFQAPPGVERVRVRELYQIPTSKNIRAWISSRRSYPDVAGAVRRRLEVDPTSGLVQLLHNGLVHELRVGVDERPLNLYWHMRYQEAHFDWPRTPLGLENEYRKLQRELGDNDPVATFLLARVVRDPAQRVQLLDASAGTPQLAPYVAIERAHTALMRTEFNEALEHAQAALKDLPDHHRAISITAEALLRLRRYDELEKFLAAKRLLHPTDEHLADRHLEALILCGRESEVPTFRREFERIYGEANQKRIEQKLIEKRDADEANNRIRTELELRSHVYAGRSSPFHRKSEIVASLVVPRLSPERIRSDEHDRERGVWKYIVGSVTGNSEMRADGELELSQVTVRISLPYELSSKWFTTWQPPEVSEVLALPMDPPDKVAYLCVLGIHYRQRRDLYFKAAEELDTGLAYPHGLVGWAMTHHSPATATTRPAQTGP